MTTSFAPFAGVIVCATLLAPLACRADDSFEAAKEAFAKAAAAELARDVLPGFSVAWIVDGQVVHAAGYGHADWKQNSPATAETIYRAGSISKLFNAIAVMQQVEQHRLDLDAPIQQALPEFSIIVPFAEAGPITLRQLLSHRSGMIRESPVGGYLDPSQPTLDAVIRSVGGCVLVNPPNTKTRYSNVGPSIAGKAVELASGLAYAEYQQQHVLGPLEMTSSAWTMNDRLRPRLAMGKMRVARGDGSYQFEAAPEFELGTLPAGNLYTTASDLARFAAFMMSGGTSGELSPPLVSPAALETMFTPQLIKGATGFGLGFYAGNYRDHKSAQHTGAVYGFTTMLVVLPKERIGVLVLSNSDIGIGPVRRLTELGLDLLLHQVHGQALPDPPQTIAPSADELARLAGEYESASYWARIEVTGGELKVVLSGQPLRLVATAPLEFLADGRIMSASPLRFEQDAAGQVVAFTAADQRFTRVDAGASAAAPEAWQAFVGKYGPKFIPLVISTRNGQLWATIENEYDYRLTPVNRVTFALPPGMYADEQIVFQTDVGGRAVGAVMANMYLPRQAD